MRSRVVKTLGLVLATVSCIGMTVFAEPSPSGTTVISKVEAATDASGNTIEVAISSEIPAEAQAAVAEVKTEAKLKEILAGDYNENMSVVDVKEVTVPEGTVFPAKLTFAVSGVTSKTTGSYLHYNMETKEWEKILTTFGDGTVTGTFDSLSPVALVVDKTTVSDGTTATSPKTSASATSVVAIIGLAAVVAVFGMKKKAF